MDSDINNPGHGGAGHRRHQARSLAGAVIGSITGISALLLYTNGQFVAGLTRDFGLTRVQFGLGVLLVTMAIAPLVTALFSRIFLHHRLPARTWGAIGLAGLGIAWMFGRQALDGGGSTTGALVALGVPMAAAANWTLLQHLHQRHAADARIKEPQMLPAVLLGAMLSAAFALPLALPLSATGHDLSWLALLGVVQLAIPCLIVVGLSSVLPAPEISLLGLLEVIFGVFLAWIGAGETPSAEAVTGGALVTAALIGNEWLGRRVRTVASA